MVDSRSRSGLRETTDPFISNNCSPASTCKHHTAWLRKVGGHSLLLQIALKVIHICGHLIQVTVTQYVFVGDNAGLLGVGSQDVV